jgi:hypothetical protein
MVCNFLRIGTNLTPPNIFRHVVYLTIICTRTSLLLSRISYQCWRNMYMYTCCGTKIDSSHTTGEHAVGHANRTALMLLILTNKYLSSITAQLKVEIQLYWLVDNIHVLRDPPKNTHEGKETTVVQTWSYPTQTCNSELKSLCT